MDDRLGGSPIATGLRAARAVGGAASRVALTLRRGAAARSPAERSVLDDVAARRPWNLVVKASRLRARLRLRGLTEGVTVVIVSWNTREVTADTLRAVRHFSPVGTSVLVVDNGSTDGSREMLQGWKGIETLLLKTNAGHGVALDLGVCAARTTVVVTLDSDAVPITTSWLEPATRPVLSGAATVAGTRSQRNFAHPVYLAIDVRAFVTRRLSFQVHRLPQAVVGRERWGEDAWDTGELMTARLAPGEVVLIGRTPNPVDGLPGMMCGGVVYHHGGVSRASDGRVASDSLAGWRAACRAVGALEGTNPESRGQQ